MLASRLRWSTRAHRRDQERHRHGSFAPDHLTRDGITADKSPYVKKQHERAESSLRWLDEQVPASWSEYKPQLSLPEIVLGSSLAWMRFRDAYPVARHVRLVRVLEALDRRPSFADTRPPS